MHKTCAAVAALCLHLAACQNFVIEAPDLSINENPTFKQGALGTESTRETIWIGDCKIAFSRQCPDPEVSFFIYDKVLKNLPIPVRVGADPFVSNITKTHFKPEAPTKIIIHGYNSDKNLGVLVEIKNQYLGRDDVNVFMVDWGPLAGGPCYPAAVWNTRHVGACVSQLVRRIRELGAADIHLIGFSLGAHVTNFAARSLAPYKVNRITGLDPAGPGFLTTSAENKLDKSDADFVDVIHTNALVQGILQESGHVDFYVNGGVVQPGCWAHNRFFACNHHRAPIYFAESIKSPVGFWGWLCPSFWDYLAGTCPPKEPQILMGDQVDPTSSGVYLVITNSVSPYAVGKFTGPEIEILLKSTQHRLNILKNYKNQILSVLDEDDLVDILGSKTNPNSSQIFEGFFDDFGGVVDDYF